MKKSTVLSMAALLAAPALLISGQAGAAETASHTKLTNCVIQEVVAGKDKKGADHVMLFDVTNKPKVGSKHTMTVFFDDGTQASCEAVVKSVKEVMKDAGIKHDGHGAHHGKHGDHSHKAH